MPLSSPGVPRGNPVTAAIVLAMIMIVATAAAHGLDVPDREDPAPRVWDAGFPSPDPAPADVAGWTVGLAA